MPTLNRTSLPPETLKLIVLSGTPRPPNNSVAMYAALLPGSLDDGPLTPIVYFGGGGGGSGGGGGGLLLHSLCHALLPPSCHFDRFLSGTGASLLTQQAFIHVPQQLFQSVTTNSPPDDVAQM